MITYLLYVPLCTCSNLAFSLFGCWQSSETCRGIRIVKHTHPLHLRTTHRSCEERNQDVYVAEQCHVSARDLMHAGGDDERKSTTVLVVLYIRQHSAQ